MKTLNKTLSLILALAMVFGLMGVASASFTDDSKITHTTAVSTCVALNIINGRTGGSFDPTGVVTRAELCKMICVAYNGGKTPVLATNSTPTYTDVKGTWGEAYIEYCTKLGVVSGNGDGTFSPDKTVTGTQAAKMMLVALGYNAANEGFTGTNWDIAVGVRANQKKLYDGLTSFDPSTGLTRDNAAQMIYSMLQAKEVSYDYKITTNANGSITTTPVLKDATDANGNSVTFVKDKYGLLTATGAFTNETYVSTKKMYKIAVGAGTYYSATDFSQYYGMNVKVLYTVDSDSNKIVYGVVSADSSVVASGIFGSVASDMKDAAAAKQFTSGSTTYKFDDTIAATPFYAFNDYTNTFTFTTVATAVAAIEGGSPTPADYMAATAMNSAIPATYEFLDTDGDGSINCVVFTPYTVQKVTALTSTTFSTSNVGLSTTLAATGRAHAAFSTQTTADVDAYTGMAKSDYVKVTSAVNTITGTDKLEKISALSGTVTKTTGTFAADYSTWQKAYVAGNWLANATGTSKDLGSYSNVIMVNGFIYAATQTSSVTSAAQYALLTWSGTSTGSAQAKLTLSDGTSKLVDTTYDYSKTRVDASGVATALSDPYTGALWAKDPVLVNYSINSSTGVYTLVPAGVGPYDGAAPTGNSYTYSASGSTIGTCKIADDAVVFASVGTSGAYTNKILTGAQLKAASAATVVNAYFTTSTSTGYNTVNVAYVTMSSYTAGVKSFGYVTAKATAVNSDNQKVTELTFWDGAEQDKLASTTISDATLAVGDFFYYTTNSDGSITPTKLVVGSAVDGMTLTKGEVLALDGSSIVINSDSTDPQSATNATSVSTSINSTSTVIFTINSAKQSGVAGTDLALADYTGTTYTQNVYYIDGGNTGVAFKLIVIDSNNAMA